MYNFRINNEIDEDFGFGTAELEAHLNAAKGDDIFIDINSIGGSVDIGMAIYAKIKRYAKENNATITTRTDGFVASIATAIFLSGDKRIVNEYMQPFVHEPSAMTFSMTADDYKQNAEMLDKIRNTMAGFYESHTNKTKEEALQLMKDNTWITADECLAMGFATEIEKLSDANLKIVAKFKNKLTKNEKKMSKPNWKERMASLIGVAKNELEIADVSGNPIVFPELDEDSEPNIEDVIVVDGDANFTGEVETNDFVMTVEDGKVTAISPILEEAVDLLLDTVEEKNTKLAEAKTENIRLNKVINALKKGSDSDPDTDKKTDKKDNLSAGASALQKAINKRKNK